MRATALFFIAFLFLVSCRNGSSSKEIINADTMPSSFSATRFSIEDHDVYNKLIISNPWQDSKGQEFIYYLVPHGGSVPDTLPGGSVIRVPVKRMICMSTTHLAMLKALEATDVIVGISGSSLVYDPDIRNEIRTRAIPDVGHENNLDKELIVSLHPDLLMAYGVGPGSTEYLRKLSDMGVAVMYNADYLEEHPLARCEWIKVFGILTGNEAKADSLYNSASVNYMRLLDTIKNYTDHRPKVLLGAPWEDVWYISPANSYAVRLISDAGGIYLFSDLKAPNSVPYSTEAVFKRATEAEVWFNPGSATRLSDIQGSDYRMAQLPVFKTGCVYNNNKRSITGGGNDYWESAVMRPDILLRDITSILHPGLLPDYSPVYYRKLE